MLSMRADQKKLGWAFRGNGENLGWAFIRCMGAYAIWVKTGGVGACPRVGAYPEDYGIIF